MNHKRGVVLVGVGLLLLLLVCTGGLATTLMLLWHRAGADGDPDPFVRSTSAANLPKTTYKLPATRPAATPKATVPAYKPDGKQVPPEDELRKLLTATILDVDKAARAKDVKLLFPRLIGFWQRIESTEKLRGSMKLFEDRPPPEFASVGDVAPIFSKPAVLTKEGEFTVGGHFPTAPNRVNFTFTYLFENGEWKLGNWSLGTAPLP
jgi:hypothetical protein